MCEEKITDLWSTLNNPIELDKVFVPMESHLFIFMFSTALSKIFIRLTWQHTQ